MNFLSRKSGLRSDRSTTNIPQACPAALALFFSRNINPPSDLEAGEKKVVMVKFFVNADGSVTQTEIIQSSGETYEREVLRAF